MRLIVYLLDGETNASSRQRVLQYVPWLRREGIEATISRPVPEGLYQRLVERGRGSSTEKAAFYGLFWLNRLRDVARADRADVAVIQRDLFPFGPPVLERLLRRRNAHIVYDTDDATYIRPSFTPNTPFQRLRAWDKPAEVAAHARWVSAATEPIAAWARQYARDVTVVPMAVDPAEYPPVAAREGRAVVLGWAGTPGGLRYLERLGPVLRQLAARHDIVVRVVSGTGGKLRGDGAGWNGAGSPAVTAAGPRRECSECSGRAAAADASAEGAAWRESRGRRRAADVSAEESGDWEGAGSRGAMVDEGGRAGLGASGRLRLPGVPVEWRAWRADRLVQDISSFDVGLVPLDDSPFERAKFPFKLLQYMALGIPSVGARVGVVPSIVEDGRNGLLAGSAEEWLEALTRVVSNVELRRRLGTAGRETVLERYTVERVGPLIVDGLARAAR